MSLGEPRDVLDDPLRGICCPAILVFSKKEPRKTLGKTWKNTKLTLKKP